MRDIEKWYYVHVRNACFGVRTTNEIVTKVAPIGKWMMGKHITKVKAIVEKKGGEFFRMGEDNEKEKNSSQTSKKKL